MINIINKSHRLDTGLTRSDTCIYAMQCNNMPVNIKNSSIPLRNTDYNILFHIGKGYGLTAQLVLYAPYVFCECQIVCIHNL